MIQRAVWSMVEEWLFLRMAMYTTVGMYLLTQVDYLGKNFNVR